MTGCGWTRWFAGVSPTAPVAIELHTTLLVDRVYVALSASENVRLDWAGAAREISAEFPGQLLFASSLATAVRPLEVGATNEWFYALPRPVLIRPGNLVMSAGGTVTAIVTLLPAHSFSSSGSGASS